MISTHNTENVTKLLGMDWNKYRDAKMYDFFNDWLAAEAEAGNTFIGQTKCDTFSMQMVK